MPRSTTRTGVALDAAGNLLIADTINNRVRAVAARTGTFYGQAMTAGDVYTIAGGGTGGIGDRGPATDAVLSFPAGLTVDPSGAVIIADAGHGRVRVVAAHTGTSYGQQMTAGDIYTVAGSGGIGFCCDGAPATTAQMTSPVRRDDGRRGQHGHRRCRTTTGSASWRRPPARSTGRR